MTLLGMRGKSDGSGGSLAFFTAGHDGSVEAFLDAGGKRINLVRAVDLDGLAGGVENDLAVRAVAEVGLKFGARPGGHRVIDQIIEKGEKLFAGHLAIPVSLGLFLRRK